MLPLASENWYAVKVAMASRTRLGQTEGPNAEEREGTTGEPQGMSLAQRTRSKKGGRTTASASDANEGAEGDEEEFLEPRSTEELRPERY